MEIDQKRIEDAIISEVSAKMISDDTLYSRIQAGVDSRINKIFQKTAEAQITSAVERIILDGFDLIYQKVDAFGRPHGEKTTVRAELEKLVSGYWNTKVDSKGEPTNSSYNTASRAEWLMTKLVAADFQGNMKQHVVNLGGVFKDKLRLELHETVNRLLSEVFRVRSAGDTAAT